MLLQKIQMLKNAQWKRCEANRGGLYIVCF
jgi:hypothetical protein